MRKPAGFMKTGLFKNCSNFGLILWDIEEIDQTLTLEILSVFYFMSQFRYVAYYIVALRLILTPQKMI
jgi:hypothetical protein